MRPTRLMLVVAIAAIAATNMSCSEDDPPAQADREFVHRLSQNIEDARAAGATDEQIAVLELASETGEVTFDAYNEAVDRALRCMRESGVEVHDFGTIDHLGLRIRDYSVPAEAEEADRREPLPGVPVHRCLAEHSFWVELAYQVQPKSLEAQEAHFEQYRPAIIDCLAEQGIEVDRDLSQEEMATEFGRDEQERNIYGRCLDETGYSRS